MNIMQTIRTAALTLLIAAAAYTANSQSHTMSNNVSAGRLYFLSENGAMKKKELNELADIVKDNFSEAGIIYSKAKATKSFPSLKPLDALVIYLDTDLNPKDLGPGKDDCPLSGYNVGESDVLCEKSYDEMKKRLGFSYDEETVRGAVVYICPGRLIFGYRLQRMLANKQDSTLTEDKIEQIFVSAATHEVAHTIGGVHIFSVGDPLYIPSNGYFMGSLLTFAEESTKFDEDNILKMHEFINKVREKNADMKSMNALKEFMFYDIIIETP
ncbi:MAG: hypothetical protein ACP5N3_02785 [Candidatus Nanoarchaeia archaeon]